MLGVVSNHIRILLTISTVFESSQMSKLSKTWVNARSCSTQRWHTNEQIQSPLKCQIWIKHGLMHGHVVPKDGISMKKYKVKLIHQISPLNNEKALKVLMGCVGYYKQFKQTFKRIQTDMLV